MIYSIKAVISFSKKVRNPEHFHQRLQMGSKSLAASSTWSLASIYAHTASSSVKRLWITRQWVRSLLVSICLCSWARYLVLIASLTWVHQRGIGHGRYYNQPADKVCSWPVAPLGEAKWLWQFSWYRNYRQKHLYPLVESAIQMLTLKHESWQPYNFYSPGPAICSLFNHPLPTFYLSSKKDCIHKIISF